MTTNTDAAGSGKGALWAIPAGALFFCLLCGYYVLRPVRDEMAARAGAGNLKWLFTATFLAMLAATPVFGWMAARLRRTLLVPGTIAFFASHLLLFRLALLDPTLAADAAPVFFVWISVFNLFVVSVFWSLMADLLDLGQATRLYGPVSLGGTLGAVTGPLLTAALVGRTGVPGLLLVAAFILVMATALAVWLSGRPGPGRTGSAGVTALGGGAWEGVTLVLRSPWLLALCAYILLHSFAGTLLYLEQTRLSRTAFVSSEERTAFFAQLDLVVNLLTAATQLFGVAPLLRRFGLPVALALLPVLTAVGLVAYGLWPTLGVLAAVGILRRAGEYAIARPAREMLFTLLPRAMKYKAKNFLDTTVFRAADAASGWMLDGLRVLGLAAGSLALAAVPAALGGAVIGWRLGRMPDARHPADAGGHADPGPTSPAPARAPTENHHDRQPSAAATPVEDRGGPAPGSGGR